MPALVYVPTIVKQLKEFYGDLLWSYDPYPSIKDHLEVNASRHFEGVKAKTDCVFVEMNNYNLNCIGKTVDQLKSMRFSEADSLQTVANEYGFNNWEEIEKLNPIYDKDFERATNDVLNGEYKSIEKALMNDKSLVSKRSNYGHRATLLHYCGSNGVEFWRQQVPKNLINIIGLLLEHGADKSATMSVYGGEFGVLSLLTTSAHPEAAGMMEELVGVLE